MRIGRSPPAAAAEEMQGRLTLVPERALRVQLAIIAALLAIYTASKALHVLRGHDYLLGFGPLFDLDRPFNLPAFYATLLMLADALLLGAIGALYRRQRRSRGWSWFFLAALLLFLAFDKAFNVHGQIGWAISEAVVDRRAAYQNVAIVGLAFTGTVAAISTRFLLRLDPRTRMLMLASGAIFVLGALGFEVLQVLRHEVVRSTASRPDAVYFALVAAEETLEMLGMALFGYTLLDHLRIQFAALNLRFG